MGHACMATPTVMTDPASTTSATRRASILLNMEIIICPLRSLTYRSATASLPEDPTGLPRISGYWTLDGGFCGMTSMPTTRMLISLAMRPVNSSIREATFLRTSLMIFGML